MGAKPHSSMMRYAYPTAQPLLPLFMNMDIRLSQSFASNAELSTANRILVAVGITDAPLFYAISAASDLLPAEFAVHLHISFCLRRVAEGKVRHRSVVVCYSNVRVNGNNVIKVRYRFGEFI